MSNNKLKYYSRHEATEDQRALLTKCMHALHAYEYLEVLGHFEGGDDPLETFTEHGPVKLEQITAPFNANYGVDGIEDTDTIIAGVFPAQALYTMLYRAQQEGVSLQIITFKFERDRTGKDGQAKVLGLKSAVIYSVTREGKLEYPMEVSV